jgi:hypothetical protein
LIYSYCIPVDDGAAPNPFFSYCTLNICKPRIRKYANVGDWVIGTGSKNSPIGDISSKLVYAMKITTKFPMNEYDLFARNNCPKKIPNWRSKDPKEKLGDSIYDFSFVPPRVRQSVHSNRNRAKDLSGEYTLVSEHFFYFGNKPIDLPNDLIEIIKMGQGHKSNCISQFEEAFTKWIENTNYIANKLYGDPQIDIFKGIFKKQMCARIREKECEQ